MGRKNLRSFEFIQWLIIAAFAVIMIVLLWRQRMNATDGAVQRWLGGTDLSHDPTDTNPEPGSQAHAAP